MSRIPSEIFKAYDIRGVVGKTLTAESVRLLGQALGTLANEKQCGAIAVGRDGRVSGAMLSQALIEGIVSAGIDVIDLGQVTTPMTYFAAKELNTRCSVAVTGSHNPPDHNGLKMVIGDVTLSGEAIQSLKTRIENNDLRRAEREGKVESRDITELYFSRIADGVKLARPVKLIVDCGNGVAGKFAQALFERLGCQVTPLFCEVDGTFPNHHPDPSKPENLRKLIEALSHSDAELGIAFDGDGDRLGVVTPDGAIIFPDRQLMLYSEDVLSREPGATIIYDVKSTRLLKPWIEKHGGVPVMSRTGHSLIKAKMKETNAALAGEMSGHLFFRERWYGFDDALYAAARLLEILSRHENPGEVLNHLPNSLSTPELNIACSREGEQHEIIAKLKATAKFPGAKDIITIDGVRVEYPDGFGLARASNTTPTLVLRFEADTPEALERIRATFKTQLDAVMK